MNNVPDNKILFPEPSAGRKWFEELPVEKSAVKVIRIMESDERNSRQEKSSFRDISAARDRSMNACLISNGTEIIITGNGSGRIPVGTDMSGMFEGFTALEKIEGLHLLDTGNVTDMSDLFRHCYALEELDLSSWDVSNVKSFRGTFCCGHNQIGDASLRSLNMKGWDVSAAVDMAYMFYGCGQLEHIDVSNWDTSGVTDFRHTFADCFQLRELDVRNWNTKSVITVDGIFNDCRSLQSIDLSNWDTSSCQEFDQMFDGCSSLKEIKGLQKLDTSEGISFEEMFYGCRNLKRLDLSSVDTRRVDGHEFTAYHSKIKSTSNMKKMLAGCNILKELQTGENFVYPVFDEVDHHILKILDDIGYIVVTPETGSMRPMLREKTDQAVFKKKNRYQKNEIVLFKSTFSSSLVMHRIQRVLPQGYMICGDNARLSEFVFRENVYAYASEIHRNGRVISRDSFEYLLLSVYSRAYDRIYHNYRNSNGILWRFSRKTKKLLKSLGV